jgi:GT2 family glycosyltransferase
MASITAVLHTHNDGLRVGRCLETLYPCDEIVIVDHGSTDATVSIARQYAATIVAASLVSGAHSKPTIQGWVLCLDPRESLSESLAASLYQWKSERIAADAAFAVWLREETEDGWTEGPKPQTRLIPANRNDWKRRLPPDEAFVRALEGRLLRFAFP